MMNSPIVASQTLLKRLSDSTQNPTMPLQQIQLFLHVAHHGEVLMEDLAAATGVEQSSVSRNVTILGDGRPNKPGYGLVRSYEDPHYRRRKFVCLTEKGKSLAWDISHTAAPSEASDEVAPQLFSFEGRTSVATFEKNGEVWFSVADVCKALELKNPRQSVATLDAAEKGVITTDTLGGPQQVTIINESGLYSLIFRSRKPSAKRFKKWVTSVVLPSVRLHGGYIKDMEGLDQENQAVTVQAVREEANRVGVCGQEEREARAKGFLAKRGRSWADRLQQGA